MADAGELTAGTVGQVPGALRRSFHLTMRDGVRVAVDLWLPEHRPSALPTALRSTRYWRAGEGDVLREPLHRAEAERWTAGGFALVLVDARGTGASFGTWTRLYDDDQRDDLVEVVDWVIAQDWSDGTVGGFGTSYDGSTAHLLAATGHPAVRAVVPRFGQLDGYHHVGAPGGVPLDWFVETWSAANWFLDGHPDRSTLAFPLPLTGRPRPVDGDDGSLLAAAQAEHAGNWDLWGTFRDGTHREDFLGADGESAEAGSPYGRLKELRAARVPMWVWSAWYDGAYAAAALAQLADPELDVRVTIGPWAHGANGPSLGSPYAPDAPVSPTPAEQQELMAGFLRHRATGTGDDPAPARLRFYTLGAEQWQEADCWPPPGTEQRRLHLGHTGTLTPTHGTTASVGHDVDFGATTGRQTRWHTLFGGVPVVYPDRSAADETLLVFDTGVLAEDLEISGTPAVALRLACDREDTSVFAYLEDVAPDGTVTYLTEGQLRALHRKEGAGSPPYETFGPWHTYAEADSAPLVPGEASTLRFGLWPVSALVRAGHRVRLALAGADAGLFRRIPEDGPVHWEVHCPDSFLDLPVRPRG